MTFLDISSAYDLRGSEANSDRKYWNAWHVESGKHVASGWKIDEVKKQCVAHAERQLLNVEHT